MPTKIKTTPRADGAALYTTEAGDMVDHICWRFYGREVGPTEAVYDANPGLTAYGPVLPEGVAIILPVNATSSVVRRDRVRLFD